VLGLDNGWINTINLTNPETAVKIRAHNKRIVSLTFASNSDVLISTSEDSALKVWKIKEDGNLICLRNMRSDHCKKAITLDNGFMMLMKPNNRNFEIREFKSLKKVCQKKIENSLKDFEFVSSLNIIFYVHENGIYCIKL
jgi:WD40 repeat protein